MSTRRRQFPHATSPAETRPGETHATPRAANVFDLRMRILPRHMASLRRWLDAGRPMGLCDAASFRPERSEPYATDYVLVWVRENADPAYQIAPHGLVWTVTDCVRDQLLARVRTFEEALNFIRPVLPDTAAA